MDIQLSPNFRKMTLQAIFSIIVFMLVYLLLLALAVALTLFCGYWGIMLIVTIPKLVTILVGVGLASFGLMILIFLFKFMFKEHSIDRSHLEEIYKEDYPALFGMIEEIAKEVETKFPKKVYLSSDVNAAVFYDSSFWSMFVPIRKNLQIGMGLVNTVTEQELKAILAHEFGHFSQRSMSVGSYVYNVNQVIYNMLYDNESFEEMIRSWASLTGYFSIFVIVAVKVIQGIQWILRKMYGFVNLRYMALSREMEFHADEVAANIAGSKPLEDSLLRLDLAQHAYNMVVNFYEQKGENGKIMSKNVYKDQSFVLNLLAKENEYPFENNLPQVSVSDLNKYNRSKLNIEDQWSSHPSTEDRVVALQKLNIVKSERKDNPAILLFSKPEDVEEKLTKNVFYNIAFHKDVVMVSVEEFKKEFEEDFNKNGFPKEYNGYYDSKNPSLFELGEITDFEQNETMESLFGKDKIDLVYELIALEKDEAILNAIDNKEIAVRSFDYDGYKYKRDEAFNIKVKLGREIKDIKLQIEQNDINIYRFFYTQACKNGTENELKDLYTTYFNEDKEYDKRVGIYNGFVNLVNELHAATEQNQLEDVFKKISKLEIELKKEIRCFMENPYLEKELTKSVNENFDKYLSRNWSYSANETSDNEYLDVLFSAVNNTNYLTSRSFFHAKLNILNFQVQQLGK